MKNYNALFLMTRPKSYMTYKQKMVSVDFDNLRGLWMLDEPSGITAFDYSANSMDGTYTGTSIVAAPDSGTAHYFDGITDFVQINHHTDLNPSTALTLSGWFKSDGAYTSYGGIAQKGAYGTGGWGLYTLSGGNLRGWIETYNLYGVQVAGLAEDTWQNLILRYDGVKLELFVSGTKLLENLSVPASITNTTDNLFLGRTEGGGYLRGSLWGIGLWASALSDQQITILSTL